MIRFTFRRLATALPTLFALLTLTFFLLRLAPGGPFDEEREWPPEIKAAILAKYELDRPVITQYAHWLRDVLHGDLHESFQYSGHPVTTIIAEALPVSLAMGGLALILATLIGITAGSYSAWKRDSWFDRVTVFLAVSGISIPTYLVASLLILIFALWLGWLPPALLEEPGSLVLPILTLAWRPLAIITRLTRASVLEALQTDYVRAAYGRGVSDFQVVFKHALRNSLIPVLTVLGPVTAQLVTGSFLVESAFQLPGMGKHFVQAVLNRDYPLVMGVTLVYGVILIGCNFAVDLLYGLVDPRIRVEAEE